MARPTNANLELGKARKSSAALELNQALVVRLLGVLQAVANSPWLAAQVAVIHPATLASTPAPALSASPVLGQQGQLAATVPPPTAAIEGRVVIDASLASALHPVVPVLRGEYDINVFRGPSSAVADDWQLAARQTDTATDDWQQGADHHEPVAAVWQEATPLHDANGWDFVQAPRCIELASGNWQEGQALGHAHGQPWEQLPPGHARVSGLWVEAADCGQWHLSGYQYPPRFDKTWQADRWQEAARRGLQLGGDWQLGDPLHLGWRDGWDEAMWPLPGISPPPPGPYIPPKPDKRRPLLAFGRKRGDAQLEFVWFAADVVVIPSRRVYFVSNAASIIRASDGLDIPATALSVDLDTDSWAWTFSASVLTVAAAKAVHGQEVIIELNGHQWRMRVDSWRDNRSWGEQSATIGGRGLTAELSADVLLEQSYREPEERRLIQLATERLPFGWTLDWQAPDWLVPGGLYGYEKAAPISALQGLAEAAAAFILPHPTSRSIQVLPHYPVAPWQLDGASPQLVIPDAIMLTLGEEHVSGQVVNGVWVAGKEAGIAARVYRQGSAGDRLLPDITHDLCTDVAAARALGIAALARAGGHTMQEVELPISADTGLILPGRLVQTSQGRGYTRAIKASAKVDGNQRLQVRQVISIERGSIA